MWSPSTTPGCSISYLNSGKSQMWRLCSCTVVDLTSHIYNMKIPIFSRHLARPTVVLCGKKSCLPRKGCRVFITPSRQPEECTENLLACQVHRKSATDLVQSILSWIYWKNNNATHRGLAASGRDRDQDIGDCWRVTFGLSRRCSVEVKK